jgi:hypothetical protein
MTTDYGYQLPIVVNPEHTLCYVIHVPDDLYHIAAFHGQIWELTRWYNWAKDEAHTAVLVANVWKGIYERMRTEDCCDCPPRIRLNHGVLQWQNGDGSWTTLDSGDERTSGTAPIPYPANPDGACLAAENITAIYQTALTQLRAGVAAAEVAVLISITITGIMGAFISPAIISTIALAITFAALEIGTTGLDNMLATDHLNNFKCSVYCHIQLDGSVTAEDFTAIRSDMATWATSVELTIIQYWLDGFGSVGLQRQAQAGGITSGDCSMCACGDCPFVNFSTANYTAILGTVGSGGRSGLTLQSTTVDGGNGIQLELGVDTTSCSANQVDFWVYVDWSSSYARNIEYELRDASETVIQSGIAGMIDERVWAHLTIGIAPRWSLSEFHLWIRTGAEGQAGLFKVDDIAWTE